MSQKHVEGLTLIIQFCVHFDALEGGGSVGRDGFAIDLVYCVLQIQSCDERFVEVDFGDGLVEVGPLRRWLRHSVPESSDFRKSVESEFFGP